MSRHRPSASVVPVDEARAVIDRLERIEALRRHDAPAGLLLGEVRALLAEAEVWAEADRPGERALEAMDRCHEAVAAGERAAERTLAQR
jgi:hypothetical protein